MNDNPPMQTCAECGSRFIVAVSPMSGLCPECAHQLYGYDNCNHQMQAGRCVSCGWDGSVSAFIKAQQHKAR